MNYCPKCHRQINEGNSPNLEECHAEIDDDEDCQCELSSQIHALKADKARLEPLLAEIRECAEAIRVNLRCDIAEELRDDVWVTTAACHAKVIVENCAARRRHER